jgi:nitroimidazol reductase NimA-like FMN-containing flavoprotein (pyridoxamine 5'-phosphate oxidase superfamily)
MQFKQTPRNRIRRIPQRGQYDQADDRPHHRPGLTGHVAFAIHGQPFVIPATHARMGDELILPCALSSSGLR